MSELISWLETYSGGWGYGPRYDALARIIRDKVPSAEVEGFVGRSSKYYNWFDDSITYLL